MNIVFHITIMRLMKYQILASGRGIQDYNILPNAVE